MKLRTLPVAVAAVAAVLLPAGTLVPAYAADPPAAPGIETVDSSVAGTVSGTVSSVDTQYVFVALAGDGDSVTPGATDIPVDLNVSNTFTLTSWGFGAGTTVWAWACPTTTFDGTACSGAAVSGAFTPTDSDPLADFSDDLTIGHDDELSVTLTDTGGGELYGQWDDPSKPLPARFTVAHSGKTVITPPNGDGVVHLFRCDNTNQDHCVELAGSPSSTYQVRRSTTAVVGPVTGVDSDSPTTTFDVTTTSTGTYTVTWSLQTLAGDPVLGYGDTTAVTPLTGSVAQDIPLDATDLPTGSYKIVGTITVVDPDFGTYTDVPLTGGTLQAGGDVTPPAITKITPSPTKIYPLISGNTTYKSTAKITVTGAGVPEVSLVRIYQKSTGTLVRGVTLTQVDATHGTASWNGRFSSGKAVPAGTYLLKIRDDAGNFSPTIGQISVSGWKLITKTWTRTISPAGTLADKYVGKCSTLRKPSLRGWYNSFGYYANTRCTSQTTANSLISTLHTTFLPSAVKYVDIRVNAYGGAARAKPGSKAVIRYLNTNGDWVSEKPMSSTLSTHTGYTRSASSLVFKDRSFGWGVYTGFGYQYDVKSFTIVLHYQVLGS